MVAESISSILKPAGEEQYGDLVDETIRDFVNRISQAEYEEFLLEDPQNKVIYDEDGRRIILTTKQELDDSITFFAAEHEGDYESEIRFPLMNKLWLAIENPDMGLPDLPTFGEKEAEIIRSKIYQALRTKFNVEF